MLGQEEKKRRIFSTDFKQEKVKEIESNRISIAQICRIYDVSRAAVYKWIYLYGTLKKRKEKIVVEKECESKKRLHLELKIKELEQFLGQKQVEVEYLKQIIKYGSDAVGYDIEKKYASK